MPMTKAFHTAKSKDQRSFKEELTVSIKEDQPSTKITDMNTLIEMRKRN